MPELTQRAVGGQDRHLEHGLLRVHLDNGGGNGRFVLKQDHATSC